MLLLYAYCSKTLTSLKIEHACYKDLAFQVTWPLGIGPR